MSDPKSHPTEAAAAAKAVRAFPPCPTYPFVPAEAVAANAAAQPDAVALSAACGTLSYGELEARAARLGTFLRARGVEPGSLVAISLERSFEQIIACLAAWKAGAAFLPLDPAWPNERLAAVLADSGCAAIVGRADLGRRAAAEHSNFIALDRDAEAISGCDEADAAAVAPDDLAYVIYTSGSTGDAQGRRDHARQPRQAVVWHRTAFGVRAGDRVAHLAGLGFDASVWEVWPALCVGASVALAPEPVRTSADAAARLADRQGHRHRLRPDRARRAADRAWLGRARRALRTLLTGADRLHRPSAPPESALRASQQLRTDRMHRGRHVEVGRRPTVDASRAATDRTADRDNARSISSTQDGHSVPPGTIGEIFIGGAGVGARLSRSSRSRCRAFQSRPVQRCAGRPPLPHRRPRLAGWPTGRSPSTAAPTTRSRYAAIASSPRKPRRRSATIRRSRPAVVDCSQHRGRRERAGRLCRAGADANLAAEELRDFLAERLPDYMIPASFVRVWTRCR